MKKPSTDHGQPKTIAGLMESFSQRDYRSKADSEHQWPASRLTHNEMTLLRRISNRVGRPINQLIRESVEVYVRLLNHDSVPVTEQQETQPITLHPPAHVARCQVMDKNESHTKETLENIHTQLQLLNDTLDGLQNDIQWALRNIVHHVSEPRPNSKMQPTAETEIDQQAMLLLRDLIASPELQQSAVCDSTRVMLERILRKIAPDDSKFQEQIKPAEDEKAIEPPAAKQQSDTVENCQEDDRTGLLF